MEHNKWQIINEEYLIYLRNYENRIPFYDYGENKLKPFFNTLFVKDDLAFVTQVTHPKSRHYVMHNNLDFYKIYDVKNDRLLCAVNLNYMFPVPLTEMKELEYKNIDLYCCFDNEIKKSQYIKLLKTEMNLISKMNFKDKAEKLYEFKYKNPQHIISKRCLNFKQLEQFAVEWNENQKNLITL